MSQQSAANAYEVLIKGLSKPSSPLGGKPISLESRKQEAHRISQLMTNSPRFSFIRLGDMELVYLLSYQDSTGHEVLFDDGPVSGTTAYTNPGIGLEHVGLLWQAFEKADYVDFHERLWPISELLSKLKLTRPAHLHQNPSPETSYILLTWLEFEFARYCANRRILLIGAEAGLLSELYKLPRFIEAAKGFWPDNCEVIFQRVRDDGKNLNKNLHLIKDDLRKAIKDSRADTVFISLGGAAKILCVELAQELNVRIFDSGSMLRALTYSGSDGNRTCRASHFPFLYRVPFSVWCDAMERAWPNLTAHEKLAKVHAQLIAELQFKEVGWTHTSWELDFSAENVHYFQNAYKDYLSRYSSLFSQSLETERERFSFLHFCGEHQLTQEGERFLRKFKLKASLRHLLGGIKSKSGLAL